MVYLHAKFHMPNCSGKSDRNAGFVWLPIVILHYTKKRETSRKGAHFLSSSTQ